MNFAYLKEDGDEKTTYVSLKTFKELEEKLVRCRGVIDSAKIFVESDGCDRECLELHNNEISCRHDDWSELAREALK